VVPRGPERWGGVGSSTALPLAGSSRRRWLLDWSVYQAAPSGASAGSCGNACGRGSANWTPVPWVGAARAISPAGASVAAVEAPSPTQTARRVTFVPVGPLMSTLTKLGEFDAIDVLWLVVLNAIAGRIPAVMVNGRRLRKCAAAVHFLLQECAGKHHFEERQVAVPVTDDRRDRELSAAELRLRLGNDVHPHHGHETGCEHAAWGQHRQGRHDLRGGRAGHDAVALRFADRVEMHVEMWDVVDVLRLVTPRVPLQIGRLHEPGVRERVHGLRTALRQRADRRGWDREPDRRNVPLCAALDVGCPAGAGPDHRRGVINSGDGEPRSAEDQGAKAAR